VTEIIGSGPLKEVESSYRLGAQPHALLHFFRRQPLPPSVRSCLWEIREGTSLCLKILCLSEYLAASGRDEARTNSGCVNEFLAPIEANNERVKPLRPLRVAADDKLLAKVDAMLCP
jgi:hypothetical protein